MDNKLAQAEQQEQQRKPGKQNGWAMTLRSHFGLAKQQQPGTEPGARTRRSPSAGTQAQPSRSTRIHPTPAPPPVYRRPGAAHAADGGVDPHTARAVGSGGRYCMKISVHCLRVSSGEVTVWPLRKRSAHAAGPRPPTCPSSSPGSISASSRSSTEAEAGVGQGEGAGERRCSSASTASISTPWSTAAAAAAARASAAAAASSPPPPPPPPPLLLAAAAGTAAVAPPAAGGGAVCSSRSAARTRSGPTPTGRDSRPAAPVNSAAVRAAPYVWEGTLSSR
ncbi:hypothetical protein TSOC_001763 [Tetrabaena socialis]|uniref:Uncharacterized protein n=1 Tax=Tetrabaena socialis TaxID=47790 RepID=A0A2J8AFS9_9CHLO|nr:hypothetical protein TSOC_001763 [Tetrabaena socialis]|eukprot:PNH11356.1 hypothetical protein TSOC_001763 [Tetrabaena socialis]